MPAFLTHYLFGRLQYEKMAPGTVKNAISAQKKVFALGLAGPDIFFYFLPDFLLGRKKVGSVMHEECCGRFLRNLTREAVTYRGEERGIALAYLAGFLGHYELDTHCHPYIYAYIDKRAEEIAAKHLQEGNVKPVSGHQKTGIHFQYEGAMDYYFLRHYTGKTPAEMNQNRLTRLTVKQKSVIARLVAAAYNRTYAVPNLSVTSMKLVLASVKFVMFCIRDPHGRRERLLAPIEKRMYGHLFSAGLFVNNNCYGIEEEEFCRLQPLFEKGKKEYAEVLEYLDLYLEAAEEEKEAAEWWLFRKIGSRSYHSGETV